MSSIVPLPSQILLRMFSITTIPSRQGTTLAAGFLLKEIQEIPRDIDHAGIFIHHDHATRSHHRTGFGELVEVHRQIEQADRFIFLANIAMRNHTGMNGSFGSFHDQGTAGRATGLHGFEAFLVRDTAADVVENFAQRDSHRDFDQDRCC